MIDRTKRNALAANISAARMQAQHRDVERDKHVFLALYCKHDAPGKFGHVIELTSIDMPRQAMQRHTAHSHVVRAPDGIKFAPWKSTFPTVITHVGIWKEQFGGRRAFLPLVELDRPVTLRPGDAVCFPYGMQISVGEEQVI